MTRESSIRLAAERARNHNKNGRHKLARTIARQLLASAEDPKNDDERAGIEMAREELGIAEFCMFPDNDNSQQLVEWWGKERNVDRGLRFAYRVLREGSPDAAARCFASLEKLDTRSVYAFYRRAMETFCSLRSAERTPLKRHRQPWLIHLPAWGYKYGLTLVQYVLPSLLAEGNLPSVASRRDVYLMIHSDHCTAELIGMSEIMTRLETLATVEFQCFDTEILDLMESASEDPCVQSSHLKYNFYGLSQVLALNAALKDSADVSFFSADVVIGNGSLKKALTFIDDGYDAVATNTFRSNLTSLQPELDRYRNEDTLALTIDPAEAVRLQIKHIHPAAQRRVVHEKNSEWNTSAQVIFPLPNGYVVRSLHYHPFLIAARRLRRAHQLDYLPLDTNFMGAVFADPGEFDRKIAVPSDASTVAVIELSHHEAEPADPERPKVASIEDTADIFQRTALQAFGSPLNLHFLRNRLFFVSDEYQFGAPEEANDIAFFSQHVNR